MNVHELRPFALEDALEYAVDPGLDRGQVRRFVVDGRAQSDAANAEKHGLLRRSKCPRVPRGVPEVQAEVDAGKNHVDVIPLVDAESDAVRRCPVDAVRLDLVEDPRGPEAHRPRRRNGVAGGRLLDVRSDHPHVAELGSPPRQRGGSDRRDLTKLLESKGHDVLAKSIDDDGWAEALGGDAELVVAAGGDGTVAKVFKKLAGTGKVATILPIGSVNNIATSLGFEGGRRRRSLG